MRKILLSLAALLTAGVAWAQDFTRLTADELNAKETSHRIAIRCTQVTDWETVYNGEGRAKLPLTAEMVYQWVPAGDGTFYIKKAFADEYLQTANITTFGTKDAETVAKFTAVCPTPGGSGVTLFGGGDCHYNTDEDKPYWVRLSLGSKWFNFNGNQYNGGTGVWTVQNVLDLSDYYKLTINIVKDNKTTTETRIIKSGEEITVPEYPLYDSDYTPTTKTASDDQTITVNYTKAKTVTVVYNYFYNQKMVDTESNVVEFNSDYPAITKSFPYGITGSKPENKVLETEAVEGKITKEITLSKTAELPFKVYADYNSVERWYYLNIRDTDPTYLKYEEGVNYIKTTDNMASVEASEDKDSYTWAFIGDANDPFAGFQMVNYKTGATMVLSAPAAPNDNKNADQLARMVTKEGASGNTAWVIKNTTHKDAASGAFYVEHPTAKAWAFNRQDYDHDADASTAAIRTLCYWNNRDTGSALQVVERPMNVASELRLLIEDAEDLYAVVNTGKTAVGYYTLESVEVLKNAIETAKSVSAATDADVETLQAAMDALETIQPEEGKFYTIQNSYSNIYMSVGNTSGMVSSEAAGFAQVFQFVSAEDGNFYLFNVERGTYLNTNKAHQQGQEFASAIVTGDAKPVKIVNLGAENHVSITPIGGATLHHDAGQGTIVAWNGGLNSRSSWKIVEVDMSAMSHSVVIAEAGWATLVLGCNAVIPADVKAYVVSATSATSAALTEITGTIPANEAVLLNAAAGTYEFKYAAEATPVAKNLLEGTVFDANVNGEAYVLAAPTVEEVAQPVGFYKAELTISTNTENDGEEGATDDTFEAFKNNAFKAYLPAPAASARFLSFDFGTETAIENIEGAETENAVVYDLYGRRVQKAQKGLYIVNGKKVVK